MAKDDYLKAFRSGKKDYQSRMLRGIKPTLQVLDDIMPEKGTYHEVPLGLVQVPIAQIVGTKTVGRSSSFAGNFMPILYEDSEFASKWINLSESQKDEGIRDPIKAYEYMKKFYVEEGNKRVSVMKYFGAVSIPALFRSVPKRKKIRFTMNLWIFISMPRLTISGFPRKEASQSWWKRWEKSGERCGQRTNC